jgi:hypothetical protein
MNFLKMMNLPASNGSGLLQSNSHHAHHSMGVLQPQLQQIYADFEVVRTFYYQRKKEIEEVIQILQERVEAERAYSLRLSKAGIHGGIGAGSSSSLLVGKYAAAMGVGSASTNPLKGIALGRLGEEVEAFKQDCQAKAKQAEELANNVQSDCIDMLKTMLQKEEERAWSVFMEAKLLITRLEEEIGNRQVKGAAAAYWRAARDAEDALTKHRQCKFALEIPITIKKNVYDHMIVTLKHLKEKESAYKEAVDNANAFMLGEFRVTLDRLIHSLVPPASQPSSSTS